MPLQRHKEWAFSAAAPGQIRACSATRTRFLNGNDSLPFPPSARRLPPDPFFVEYPSKSSVFSCAPQLTIPAPYPSPFSDVGVVHRWTSRACLWPGHVTDCRCHSLPNPMCRSHASSTLCDSSSRDAHEQPPGCTGVGCVSGWVGGVTGDNMRFVCPPPPSPFHGMSPPGTGSHPPDPPNGMCTSWPARTMQLTSSSLLSTACP